MAKKTATAVKTEKVKKEKAKVEQKPLIFDRIRAAEESLTVAFQELEAGGAFKLAERVDLVGRAVSKLLTAQKTKTEKTNERLKTKLTKLAEQAKAAGIDIASLIGQNN